MNNGRVMIVEDEPMVAEAIEINLESFGYEVVAKAAAAEEAIDLAQSKKPDVILMDIMLSGDMDGIVAAQKIQDAQGIPIVFLTAYDDEQTLSRASITEPFGYILKPFSPRELNAIIAMALYKSRSEKKLLEANCSSDVFANLSDAVVGLDRNSHILLLNQSAVKLLCIDEKTAINQPWDKLIVCARPEEQSRLKEIVDNVDIYALNKRLLSTSLLSSQKSVLSVDVSVCPVHEKNSLLTTVIVLRDITERKKTEQKLKQYHEHLEELVEERTQELHYINQELDAYNYSVSHDLRSPLRAIDGFSALLKEDYGDILDETANNYLNRISAASHRMEQLIDDLLMLSRISMENIVCDNINLTHLVTAISDSLKERNPERSFNMEIQEKMFVNADIRLLRILLENLIDNAVKFSSMNKIAKIEVGEMNENGEQRFFVHDNGVGFDMQYVDKMFRVFQRLHTNKQFEGSGVGLALCQRIVNKHHGEIWAESEAGKGTWLFFTLHERSCDKKQA